MGRKRNAILYIRLTNEEKKKLVNYSCQNNLSLNEIIVEFINNLEIKEVK